MTTAAMSMTEQGSPSIVALARGTWRRCGTEGGGDCGAGSAGRGRVAGPWGAGLWVAEKFSRGGRAVFRRAIGFSSPGNQEHSHPSRGPTQALRLRVIFKRSNMNA